MGVWPLDSGRTMVAPESPRSPQLITDSTVLETACLAAATTLAIILAAVTAFAAASAVGDDSPLALPISLVVGLVTVAMLVVGAKAIGRGLVRELDRLRSSATGSRLRIPR